LPDGKTSDERTKADDVTYSKVMTHAYENLADTASESLMVELKKPGAAAAAKATLDPVKLDPKHYKVVINNDQVRVLRAKYGPHEKSVMHEHPASVAVFMSDGHVKFTLPDGTSQDNNAKAHDATWADAGKHLPENVGDTPLEVIVVELKK
jgi:mannose-6-phosphate isomerase-like protein (cupin superfamily)